MFKLVKKQQKITFEVVRNQIEGNVSPKDEVTIEDVQYALKTDDRVWAYKVFYNSFGEVSRRRRGRNPLVKDIPRVFVGLPHTSLEK